MELVLLFIIIGLIVWWKDDTHHHTNEVYYEIADFRDKARRQRIQRAFSLRHKKYRS